MCDLASHGVRQQRVREPLASWPAARQSTTPAIASTAAISPSARAQRRPSTRSDRCRPASQRIAFVQQERPSQIGLTRSACGGRTHGCHAACRGDRMDSGCDRVGARAVAHWLHHDPRRRLETAGKRVGREPADDRAGTRSERAARLLRAKRAGRSTPWPIPGLSEGPVERARP